MHGAPIGPVRGAGPRYATKTLKVWQTRGTTILLVYKYMNKSTLIIICVQRDGGAGLKPGIVRGPQRSPYMKYTIQCCFPFFARRGPVSIMKVSVGQSILYGAAIDEEASADLVGGNAYTSKMRAAAIAKRIMENRKPLLD